MRHKMQDCPETVTQLHHAINRCESAAARQFRAVTADRLVAALSEHVWQEGNVRDLVYRGSVAVSDNHSM